MIMNYHPMKAENIGMLYALVKSSFNCEIYLLSSF